MTLCQKRAIRGWHEPLVYAGITVSSSRPCAENDNGRVDRALRSRRYAQIAQTGLVVMSALSVSGASILFAGGVLGWW